MALVSKILESTLTAGSTAVTFTDSDIPNSLIRVFSSDSNIIPESRILSGNTLTVIYAPQSNNIDVAVEIVKQGLDIVDNVLSEDTDKALSAKQGYLLSAAIGDVNDRLDALVIPENITDLDDVNVTSIEDGQVLAWDAIAEKFKNVNQSSGSFTLIKKAWTATSSSTVGTVLTESAELTAGVYIISVHTAPANVTTLQAFTIALDNVSSLDHIESITPTYGNYCTILELTETKTLTFVTASGASMLWDSQYISRGGMNILKIS